MEETLPNKGILEKLTREGKSLAFYIVVNKAETLKHLIVYNNLRAYINPKGMIGMLITGHHVWGHAYGHDNGLFAQVKCKKH